MNSPLRASSLRRRNLLMRLLSSCWLPVSTRKPGPPSRLSRSSASGTLACGPVGGGRQCPRTRRKTAASSSSWGQTLSPPGIHTYSCMRLGLGVSKSPHAKPPESSWDLTGTLCRCQVDNGKESRQIKKSSYRRYKECKEL
jgi:hypothetical protein